MTVYRVAFHVDVDASYPVEAAQAVAEIMALPTFNPRAVTFFVVTRDVEGEQPHTVNLVLVERAKARLRERKAGVTRSGHTAQRTRRQLEP